MSTATTTTMIQYAWRSTQLGPVFAAQTERGLCMLHLVGQKSHAASMAELRRRYPEAVIQEDEAALEEVFRNVDAWSQGDDCSNLALDLQGTPFQQKVWRALRRVEAGKTVSYSELARRAGAPRAVRAAASACARNPVALFVPCHRIVRRDGGLGGYAGGIEHKRRLLELEGALTSV
jgi:AraC family transcriptional regulator, regulatory protein of adaptative response / methylated-DNA-[protein]-cysteine methyltransferase